MNNQYIIELFSAFTQSYNADPNNSGNTLTYHYGDSMLTGNINYYPQLFLNTSFQTDISYESGYKNYTYVISPEISIKLNNLYPTPSFDDIALLDNVQLNIENFFKGNFPNKTNFLSLSSTDYKTISPDLCYTRLINISLQRKETFNINNIPQTIVPFKNNVLKNIDSITQPSGDTSMQINISDGTFYNINLPSGEVTGKTITNITQPSGITSMTINYTDSTFDIIDLPKGEKGDKGDIGLTGQSGTSISSITQSNITSMTVNLSNNTSYNVNLPSGATGTSGVSISSVTQSNISSMTVTLSNGNTSNILLPSGATGSQGQSGLSYNILSLVNNYEYLDHLIPAGASSNQTQNFQAIIRSGTGSAGFLNQSASWLGGTGIIRLSTGTATATDVGIRATAGLSGHLINSNVSEYYFGFYSTALQNSTNLGLFRLCVQNGSTATVIESNRTGVYVDFDWQTDGVKPTFSIFNNTVSSSVLLNYPLSINTLYAVRIRVSNTFCELYINNVLIHSFNNILNNSLPIFAPIQQSVGLTKTAGSTGVTYLVDVLGARNLVNLNNYNF